MSGLQRYGYYGSANLIVISKIAYIRLVLLYHKPLYHMMVWFHGLRPTFIRQALLSSSIGTLMVYYFFYSDFRLSVILVEWHMTLLFPKP